MRKISIVPSLLVTMTCVLSLMISDAEAQTPTAKTIATVTQRGSFLYLYDAKGIQISVIAAGDGMVGYTSSSVSVRRGNFVYVFDAGGKQTSVIPAGAK